MKKQNKKLQNTKSIHEKLKTKSLMFFVLFFHVILQDFKFWYMNRKAFGTSFLYWVDFTIWQRLKIQCSLGSVTLNFVTTCDLVVWQKLATLFQRCLKVWFLTKCELVDLYALQFIVNSYNFIKLIGFKKVNQILRN